MRTLANVDYRWLHRLNVFWLVIMAGLLLTGSVRTVTEHPAIVHSWNGLATAALVLGYGIWFFYMMRLRYRRGVLIEWRTQSWRIYALVAPGLAFSVVLVLLHNTFTGIIFADIGLIAFAMDGWSRVAPTVLLGGLFLYVIGSPASDNLANIAGALLTLLSTAALIYSLAALMRQRGERDRLIAELREAHEELRITAARDVELAALRERNRLAREMHDSLGHALVLIAIKIEAAQRLQMVDPTRATIEWEETKALVRSTMSALRNSLAGLRVPALEERPFRDAFAELGAELERSGGIEVSTHIPTEADRLDTQVQEALYRIAQEALANVAKHARAHRVSITLACDERFVLLEVDDDGVGLENATRANGGHYGILGMRERVQGFGGVLTLGPRPDGGTSLKAKLSLEERADVRHPHLVG